MRGSQRLSPGAATTLPGSLVYPTQRLAGPALICDLESEWTRLHALDRGVSGRSAMTLVKERDLRVVLVTLHCGARLDRHLAPGSITIQTLMGRLRLQLADQTVELPIGQVLTLGRDTPHDVEALEESAFLLTVAWSPQSAGTLPEHEE